LQNSPQHRPPTTPPGVSRLARQVAYLTEQMHENRRLAMFEFEWLASLYERICFIVFLGVFLLLSIGINGMGYMHWLNEIHVDYSS
jgi:hypothetical protein